jgi:hypothetical protein
MAPFINPNPNEPNFPYGGGTDNPGDNTALAGGGVQTETGAPPTQVIFPSLSHGLAKGSDTVIPVGFHGDVPMTDIGFESTQDADIQESDPAGQLGPREAGQDETVGETETTSGVVPTAFPEPQP